MSFWSYTGKLYIPSTGFSENVGIRGCIKKYKKLQTINKQVEELGWDKKEN